MKQDRNGMNKIKFVNSGKMNKKLDKLIYDGINPNERAGRDQDELRRKKKRNKNSRKSRKNNRRR